MFVISRSKIFLILLGTFSVTAGLVLSVLGRSTKPWDKFGLGFTTGEKVLLSLLSTEQWVTATELFELYQSEIAVLEQSGKAPPKFQRGLGSVYVTLGRFEEWGLVERQLRPNANSADKPFREYRLSSLGVNVRGIS